VAERVDPLSDGPSADSGSARPSVGVSDLEADLEALCAGVADPRAGIFGPGTRVWEVAREAVIFLGAGRAALLQLAHPYVGVAVAEHSVTRENPLARFQGTFRRIFRMVFGDLEEAVGAARDVYRVHGKIRGTIPEQAGRFPLGHAYDARDRAAQVWVLATLWDTSLFLFDRIVRPLTAADREQYYDESRRFARLFGIASALPPTYAAFQDYVRDMLAGDTLAVTAKGAEVGRFIMRPPNFVGRIVGPDFGCFTAHLLPERIGIGFGLERGGERGRKRFEAILDTARVAVPRLPARVRYLPAYIEAQRRIAGDERRDRLGELMTKLYLG